MAALLIALALAPFLPPSSTPLPLIAHRSSLMAHLSFLSIATRSVSTLESKRTGRPESKTTKISHEKVQRPAASSPLRNNRFCVVVNATHNAERQRDQRNKHAVRTGIRFLLASRYPSSLIAHRSLSSLLFRLSSPPRVCFAPHKLNRGPHPHALHLRT